MSRNRVLQFVLPAALLLIGQWNANSWTVDWREVVASENGRIFTASKYARYRSAEIRQWSSDLSSSRVLARPWSYYGSIHPNNDGTILVCDEGSHIRAIDTATGAERWRDEKPEFRKPHVLQDDRYVMIAVFGSSNSLSAIVVLDLQTGQEVDEFRIDLKSPRVGAIRQLYFRPTGITVQYELGDYLTFKVKDEKISPSDETATDDSLVGCRELYERSNRFSRMIEGSGSVASLPADRQVRLTDHSTYHAARISVFDASSNQEVYRRHAGSSIAWMWCLGSLFVMGGLSWVVMLMRDSASNLDRRKCGLRDLGLFAAFLMLATIPGWGEFVPRYAIEKQWIRVLAAPSAILVWWLFVVLLGVRRRLYVWSLILCSCAVPIVLPIVLLGLLAGLVEITSPFAKITNSPAGDSGQQFRFQIGDLLLVTSALAILMSVGVATIDLVPYGLGYAISFGLGVVLSLGRTLSKITVGICVCLLLATATLHPEFGEITWLMNHCVMLVLTFSFLSLYGFRLISNAKEKPPVEIQQAVS